MSNLNNINVWGFDTIQEDDESDMSEDDEEGDKGAGPLGVNGPVTKPRRYAKYWDSILDFDANLDDGNDNANNLSKEVYKDNFILKELPPAETRAPPVPKKRTNVMRPLSDETSKNDTENDTEIVQAKLDFEDEDAVKKKTSDGMFESEDEKETKTTDGNLDRKQEAPRTNSYHQIGEFTVTEKPVVSEAPALSLDNKVGATGRIFVNNPTMNTIFNANKPGERTTPSQASFYTNQAFEADGRELDARSRLASDMDHKDAEEGQQKGAGVHWGKDVKDSDDEKKEEVFDLDHLDWDVFRSYRYDTNAYSCEKTFKIGTIVLKILFVVISFFTILASLIISKLSILFATSSINANGGFRIVDDGCSQPVMYAIPACQRRDQIRWLWCILLSMCTPYVIIFLHSMWKICFKKKASPSCGAVCFVIFMESLHTAGLMVLFFIVLPYTDILQAMFIMNATAFLPSFFKLFIRPKDENRGANIFLDLLAFLTQVLPLVLYPVAVKLEERSPNITSNTKETASCQSTDANSTVMFEAVDSLQKANDADGFAITLALVLISCAWWQNFVDRDLTVVCRQGFLRLSRDVKKSKTKISAIVSIWKMVLSFSLFLVIARFYILSEDDPIGLLFGIIEPHSNSSPFRDHVYMNNLDKDFENDWLIVFGANAAAGVVGYVISLNAIQAKVQKATYSLAILFSTPVALLIGGLGFCSCDETANEMASLFNIKDLYWNCFGGFEYFDGFVLKDLILVLGIAWWVGQFILTRHLWSPKSERLAKASRIFVQPFYCGLLLEQSFALNRSRHDKFRERRRKLPRYKDNVTPGEERARHETTIRHRVTAGRALSQEETHEFDELADTELSPLMTEDPLYDRPDKSEPMIFICATMWHETEQEMEQMLKSIIRLDRDQAIRRLTKQYFDVQVPDFYSFEGHIFFDDAFNKYIPGDTEITVNRFVAQFVKIINGAASYVHGANVEIEPPKKIPTPYGGKLVFVLPGGNLLYMHLKDKQKIRHRKRWSQVMYMYYLLGYRLWDKPIKRSIKEEVAYNTYILTLDGDVDFKPQAVILLIDLMRRNFGVGAACGRIHPEGSGPMVWYQKFEYAISHWLQKTTEHVLGCVLCSPGCFSLFRASALMDDNVMKTYSMTAEEALHYVQYDQGEDRWLCTLLLQRGYRVEYSAAADALTYAPEGFNEFFNQRRRWTPSTFANILDLLSSGRATAKRNQNISILYIIYQAGLMFSSVVGPATILLMIVSAFQSVFPSISLTGAFFMVFVPVLVFFALCLFAKQGTQLGFAALLSALFASSQMVVFVGLIIGIAEDGLCSPTSWFLLGTAGIFIISGILHPQEITILIHGILFFLLIPTMYLLLIIYSLCNLNVVTWGTREVIQTNAEKEKLKQRELELTAKEAGAAAKKTGSDSGLMGMFGGILGGDAADGSGQDGWTLACGDCCRCLCCPREGESYTDKKISKLQKQVALLPGQISRLADESSDASSEGSVDETQPLMLEQAAETKDEPLNADESQLEPDIDDDDDDGKRKVDEYSDSKPFWTQDFNSVGKGPVGTLDEKEEDFWKHLIRRYLLPIEKNPEREERIKKDLISLRNKAVIAFFMIDILFMVLFMSLAAVPVDDGSLTSENRTNYPVSSYYLEFQCTDPVTGIENVQYIEPIGFAFLLVFGSFLVIQFIGMLFHRLFSLIQVVSSTVICKKRHSGEPSSYLELTEMLSKMTAGDDTSDTASNVDSLDAQFDPDYDNEDGDHEKEDKKKNYGSIIKKLENKQTVYRTMDKTFAQRFLALNAEVSKSPIPQEPSIADRPANFVRRRLSSIFQRPANAPYGQQGGPSRRPSFASNVLLDLRRKQTEIFTPEREAEIKQRFRISDGDIRKEERKMGRLIPEVRNLRAASVLSGDTSIELNTAPYQ